MTARERWLIAGLVLVSVLLVSLGFWQHVRFADAEQAARRLVMIEGRIERGPESEVVLLKQAQPELRRHFFRGEFAAALRRMEALDEEQDTGEEPVPTGKALNADRLWPAGSPARKRAKVLLLAVTQKQRAGYDLEQVQDALVRMAAAARGGKKDVALAAFSDAERLLGAVRLRPGFRTAGARPEEMPQAIVAGGLPQQFRGAAADLQVPRMIQLFRSGLPMLRERAVTPEQRRFLDRLAPFVDDLDRAYRAGKDVLRLAPLLQGLGAAVQQEDLRTAHRLLAEAQAALPGLPRRAEGADARPAMGRRTAGTVPPSAGAGPGAAAALQQPPAGLPAAGGPPVALVLATLDRLRALPDAEYRIQREQVGGFISRALAARAAAPPGASPGGSPAGGGAPTVPPPGPSAAPVVPPGVLPPRPAPPEAIGEALRLYLGSRGEIAGVRLGARDLSRGADTGGWMLVAGDHLLPVGTPLRRVGETLVQEARGPEGSLVLTYRAEANGVRIDIEAGRSVAGDPRTLRLRLPLRTAGWRAGADSASSLLGADETRRVDGGPTPLDLLLTGPGRGLRIQADRTSLLLLEPGADRVQLDLPLPGAAGESRWTVRLTALAP